MLATLLCAVSLQTQSTPPPFNRIWTHLVYGDAAVHRVQQEEVFFTGSSGVGVLDLKTGKPKWEKNLNWTTEGTSTKTHVVCAYRPESDVVQVDAFDTKTGQPTTLYKGDQFIYGLAANDDAVFILLEKGKLTSIDPSTTKENWTINLNPSGIFTFGSGSLTFGNGILFAGYPEIGSFCIDPSTGKIKWEVAEKNDGVYDPVFLPQGVLCRSIPTTLRDTQTGKIKWTKEGDFETLGLINNVLVGELNDEIIGTDPETGKTL